MSEVPKKPVWPLIVALLIGLPVLYVASFGPACWLADRGRINFTTVVKAYPKLYRHVAFTNESSMWSRAFRWYAISGTSSKSEVEITVQLCKAQLDVTKERVAQRNRIAR